MCDYYECVKYIFLYIWLCVKLCDGSVYYECVKYISLYMVVCKVVLWFSLNFDCVRYISLYRGVCKVVWWFSILWMCELYNFIYRGVCTLQKILFLALMFKSLIMLLRHFCFVCRFRLYIFIPNKRWIYFYEFSFKFTLDVIKCITKFTSRK